MRERAKNKLNYLKKSYYPIWAPTAFMGGIISIVGMMGRKRSFKNFCRCPAAIELATNQS